MNKPTRPTKPSFRAIGPPKSTKNEIYKLVQHHKKGMVLLPYDEVPDYWDHDERWTTDRLEDWEATYSLYYGDFLVDNLLSALKQAELSTNVMLESFCPYDGSHNHAFCISYCRTLTDAELEKAKNDYEVELKHREQIQAKYQSDLEQYKVEKAEYELFKTKEKVERLGQIIQ